MSTVKAAFLKKSVLEFSSVCFYKEMDSHGGGDALACIPSCPLSIMCCINPTLLHSLAC